MKYYIINTHSHIYKIATILTFRNARLTLRAGLQRAERGHWFSLKELAKKNVFKELAKFGHI